MTTRRCRTSYRGQEAEEEVMPNISQDEFDRVLSEVERKTCFRFTAGTRNPASSAFMVPVAQDGKTVIGECVEFSWKQLVGMSELPEKPA